MTMHREEKESVPSAAVSLLLSSMPQPSSSRPLALVGLIGVGLVGWELSVRIFGSICGPVGGSGGASRDNSVVESPSNERGELWSYICIETLPASSSPVPRA